MKNPSSEDFDWLCTYWGSDIKRIFYIYNTPGTATRGFHRHQKCQMGLVCLVGSVQIYIQTPKADQYFRLDSSTQMLLVAPTDWRVMYNFSSDATLLVLADKYYQDTIYIDEPYRPLPLNTFDQIAEQKPAQRQKKHAPDEHV